VSISVALRRYAVLASIAILALVGSAVARADLSVGNQDPDVVVTAGLVSNNPTSPDIATRGDWIKLTLGVKNVSATKQWVHIYIIPTVPWTELAPLDYLVQMKAGQKYALTLPIRVKRFLPAGVYSIGVIAESENETATLLDPSSAFASLTVL
jgi:uncharacterized protein YfaS (alpha-2-macroglobulin family)